METSRGGTIGTHKVRREVIGSKRAEGWGLQKANRKTRRADASRLKLGKADPSLSGLGGLVAFNAFLKDEGLGKELRERFGHLKTGRQVVYPMHVQMQTLLDAIAAGATRVYDFEALSGDAVFRHLAGGAVSSVDVLYDDLRRMEPAELEQLEEMVSIQARLALDGRKFERLTVDVDTTVCPVFGSQEGAEVGPNPRYRGRRSYHPILARIAEVDTVLGVRLRPGNTGLGECDTEDIEQWLDRLEETVGRDPIITVRIDAGGDCAALLNAITARGAHVLVKAKQTGNLLHAAMFHADWEVTDTDANGSPTRRVGVLDFRREDWPEGKYRVIAVRSTERDNGRQTCLWPGSDDSVQFFITSDMDQAPDDLALFYDARAGIEPLIGTLKQAFGIGKVSTDSFNANEAFLLLKVLAYNLMRRWVMARYVAVSSWSPCWIRRALIQIPGRLLRSGGRWELRLAPRPLLN